MELKPKYNQKEVEEGRYDYWLKHQVFKSGDKNLIPYTVVIPPPNVTGILHIGHALDFSLQDIICRRKRMQGYDVLYLPGMDHAGIATQAKVDAKLKAQGISRYDLGREKYLEVAWQWKKDYSEIIRNQWAKLGLSLDYSKERFTLDEGLNKTVRYVFKTLYDKGIIYQGKRIINWDPQARTALSNVEIEHKDIEGAFYHIRYNYVDGNGGIIIATTRPETMFADQALMVNPKDERYKDVIGKEVYIPTTNIKIPVIADEYVDMEFGTGAVKVTPAHDPNDYMVGKRHNLEMPLCMNDDGTMNEMAHKYSGMDRFDCRKALVKDLEESGQLLKIEKVIHNVGHSERTGVVVEPRLSKQWFVKMKPLAEAALKKSEVRFVPERFNNTFRTWMENVEDWCISRQLWWGHRIPVWYRGDEIVCAMEAPSGDGWVQDEDVLDTWFSSALWPFSTLDYLDNSELYKRYFPTDCLVTGYDIIFFWVSRMIFQSLEFTGKSPFKDCVIHGLVRDSQGRKMSKTLGNGIDPIAVIDKYGVDSLRYFITTNSTPGQDINYDETKVESSWNFINKLWNISRYVMMTLENEVTKEEEMTIWDKWILTRLNEVIKTADYYYDKYEFNEVAKIIYNFTWDDFASWYLEISKLSPNNSTTHAILSYVLTSVIKLLHPFIPFVTEEIYLSMYEDQISIQKSKWPEVVEYNFDFSQNDIDTLMDIIRKVRTERNNYNVPLSKKINMYIHVKDEHTLNVFNENKDIIQKFLNPDELVITLDNLNIPNSLNITSDNYILYIPMGSLVDKEAEIQRLNNELKKIEGELLRSEKILSNPNFLAKASKEKIEEEKEKELKYKETQKSILKALEALK